MNVFERLRAGEHFHVLDSEDYRREAHGEFKRCRHICHLINATDPDDQERIVELERELFNGRLEDGTFLTPPFQIDAACRVFLGKNVFANHGLTVMSVGTITNAVLQAIGKMNMPIVSAGISLVIQTVVLVLFLRFSDWGIYSMVLVSVLYAAIIFVLNEFFLRRYLGIRVDAGKAYGKPVLSAAVMGAAAYGVYRGIFALALRFWGEYFANFAAVLPAILVAVPVYFFLLIRLGGFTQEDILGLPKGEALVRLLKKLRWLK